ncbi:MAG: hypothetical protein BM558_09475 [Roseobacter sp. MedPE-SW]|mgnify:CR=1 FL=1|nr:MAG: hypothetical protein BM558_09475 [Roseobacter sp. MedPE-SW]
MKPGFALSLSTEGIVLLHRAAGGWRNVGSVVLDSDDLSGDLAALRAKGEALEPKGQCKLIIPNDQIRYLTIETGISDQESRRRLARAALEGATPYAVSDLSFDLSEDGSQTHIAAVAYETLAEAESFALENGFTPVSFVATPGDTGFLGEPFFGAAPSLGDVEITPDGIAVVDIGPAEVPNPEPNASPSAAGPADTGDKAAKPSSNSSPVEALPKAPAALPATQDADQATAEEATTEDSGPIAGFSSRRRKSPGAAPASPKPPAQAKQGTDAKSEAPQTTPATQKSSAPAVNPDAAAAVSTKPVQAPAAKGDSAAKSSGTAAAPKVGAAISAGPTPALAPEVKPSGSTKPARSHPDSSGAASAIPQAPAPGKSADLSGKPTVAKATPPAAIHPKVPAVSGTAAKAANSLTQDAETKQGNKGGKPRFLGLILTAVLLLAMAAIAAFALFSEGGLFFSSERPPVEESTESPLTEPAEEDTGATEGTPAAAEQPTASPPDPSAHTDVPIAEVETEPDSIAPQVSAIPSQPDPGVVELSDLPLPGNAAPPETDSQLDASTGQPVLDALEDNASEQAASDALSEAALYAATGIWQQVPQIAEVPALVSLDDIYIASIDNSNLSQDAVALPGAPEHDSDPAPDALSSPAAAGSDFALDNRGLVTATPEGTLNPDGVMVYLGRPSVTPPPTPVRTAPEAANEAAENARLASLSLKRPRPRPSDLLERAERALLGGLSREELSRVRPRARPASLKTEEQESQPVSDLAIATSTLPRARPANFANLVDRATRQRDAEPASAATAAAVVAPRSVTPSIPSSASVARQATVKNAINLRRINLIGVSGKPSNRQALILMPTGRTRQVRVGDRLDGGTVVAISNTQLQYQKRGTNTTLKLPND